MEDILALVMILVIIIGAMVFVTAIRSNKEKAVQYSPTQALATNDVWYKQALNMARLLERINSDPMVNCTFDNRTKEDVSKVLNKFWSDHELEP